MTHEAIATMLALAGVLLSFFIFVYTRVTNRFDRIDTGISARFTAIEVQVDEKFAEVKKDAAERVESLSRKMSHNSRALTRIVASQKVQTKTVSKLIVEQEALEEVCSELRIATRLLSQQMEQHQSWHKEMIEAVDRESRKNAGNTGGH